MFVVQAHLLQLQQTGNHLQVVFHTVMNFFEQDIFVVECIIERSCPFLDDVFELCFIAHEFPGAQSHEGEKENRQCKNYNRVEPDTSVQRSNNRNGNQQFIFIPGAIRLLRFDAYAIGAIGKAVQSHIVFADVIPIVVEPLNHIRIVVLAKGKVEQCELQGERFFMRLQYDLSHGSEFIHARNERIGAHIQFRNRGELKGRGNRFIACC